MGLLGVTFLMRLFFVQLGYAGNKKQGITIPFLCSKW
jgi:hypothetical protein